MRVPETILRQVFVTEYGCHLWLGKKSESGYGRITLNGKGLRVHRVMWEMTGHDLPDYVPGGKQIDHLCLDKSCCNPAHIELVTQRINMQRRAANKTHCINGHYLTETNTVMIRGYRQCKQCSSAQNREWRTREKGSELLPPCAERTHCQYGHLYDKENTRVTKDGHRYCRACNKRRNREWREKGN